MSFWYEVKKDDLSLSADGSELHAYLFSDENGAVYASIETKDLRDKLTK